MATDLPADHAEVGRMARLVARLFDLTLVVVPFSLLAYLAEEVPAWILSVLYLVTAWVYSLALEARTGQTVGKRLSRIRVVAVPQAGSPSELDAAGASPGWRTTAFRDIWILFAVLPGVAGALFAVAVPLLLAGTIVAGAGHRGLHDRLAGTAVVPAGARSPR